jgi:hypothetical protein
MRRNSIPLLDSAYRTIWGKMCPFAAGARRQKPRGMTHLNRFDVKTWNEDEPEVGHVDLFRPLVTVTSIVCRCGAFIFSGLFNIP